MNEHTSPQGQSTSFKQSTAALQIDVAAANAGPQVCPVQVWPEYAQVLVLEEAVHQPGSPLLAETHW